PVSALLPEMRAVCLFSGCGGLDLGLERAGFEIALATDNDPVCAESYRANFPTVPFHLGDAELISWREMVGLERVDLLAGGPPCPPYSKSRFYRKEKPRALDDSLGWSTLNAYLAALEALRPRAFLLENVA